MKTIIMKFGGASVATPESFHNVADIIHARSLEYDRIAVVVSAMGNMTDQLISLAKQVNEDPPKREYDMLITVGERISISLLAMALASRGSEAISYTGSQTGIITSDEHTNANIIDVRPYRLISDLNDGKIVIVAGFQGVSENKEITTLGRGGTDTTAVALGIALDAEKIEFYKDVSGIYEEDPKENPESEVLPEITYGKALEILNKGACVLHDRAVILAQKNGILLHVRSFSDSYAKGTIINDPAIHRSNEKIYEESKSFVT